MTKLIQWSVRYYLEGDNNRSQQARVWKDHLTKEEAEREVITCYNSELNCVVVWAVSEWAEVGRQLRRGDFYWFNGIPFCR